MIKNDLTLGISRHCTIYYDILYNTVVGGRKLKTKIVTNEKYHEFKRNKWEL